MENRQIPVKYILYSHYSKYEKDDFEEWRDNGTPTGGNNTVVRNLKGMVYLRDHLAGLQQLLKTRSYEGMLVLFYDVGYEFYIKRLTAREVSEGEIAEGEERLRFAEAVSVCVMEELVAHHLEDRVRFITPLHLEPVLGRIGLPLARGLRVQMFGRGPGVRYDSTKIIEAIIRLRVLGNGIPVLRLDQDVLFRKQKENNLGLFKAAVCSVQAYRQRVDAPTVSTFLFSASYDTAVLKDPPPGMDDFGRWGGAFSTRIYPCLIADRNELLRIHGITDKDARDAAWKRYVSGQGNEHINDALARKFFGIKDDVNGFEAKQESGITTIGVHPYNSVISGALLCLSDAAILDLPPFSNYRRNVMWIDDHLKYSLHSAMGHLRSDPSDHQVLGLGDARMGDVYVTKDRPPVGNLINYIFSEYLPNVFRGAIMDAWINGDNCLPKHKREELPEEDRHRWDAAKKNVSNSPLPNAMLGAFRTGELTDDDSFALKVTLRESAMARVSSIRRLWADLKTGTEETFASYWATGAVASNFRECFEEGGSWMGIGPGVGLKEPLNRENLGPLRDDLEELIEDTVDYVDWALKWPTFVLIVRSAPQGSWKGDLTWRPT